MHLRYRAYTPINRNSSQCADFEPGCKFSSAWLLSSKSLKFCNRVQNRSTTPSCNCPPSDISWPLRAGGALGIPDARAQIEKQLVHLLFLGGSLGPVGSQILEFAAEFSQFCTRVQFTPTAHLCPNNFSTFSSWATSKRSHPRTGVRSNPGNSTFDIHLANVAKLVPSP